MKKININKNIQNLLYIKILQLRLRWLPSKQLELIGKQTLIKYIKSTLY